MQSALGLRWCAGRTELPRIRGGWGGLGHLHPGRRLQQFTNRLESTAVVIDEMDHVGDTGPQIILLHLAESQHPVPEASGEIPAAQLSFVAADLSDGVKPGFGDRTPDQGAQLRFHPRQSGDLDLGAKFVDRPSLLAVESEPPAGLVGGAVHGDRCGIGKQGLIGAFGGLVLTRIAGAAMDPGQGFEDARRQIDGGVPQQGAGLMGRDVRLGTPRGFRQPRQLFRDPAVGQQPTMQSPRERHRGRSTASGGGLADQKALENLQGRGRNRSLHEESSSGEESRRAGIPARTQTRSWASEFNP